MPMQQLPRLHNGVLLFYTLLVASSVEPVGGRFKRVGLRLFSRGHNRLPRDMHAATQI